MMKAAEKPEWYYKWRYIMNFFLNFLFVRQVLLDPTREYTERM